MYNYARMRRFGKGTLTNKSNALIYFKLQQTKELMKQYDWLCQYVKKKKREGTDKNNAKSRRYYKMADDHKNTNWMFIILKENSMHYKKK